MLRCRNVSPSEIHRFASLFRAEAASVKAPDIREGETATDAAARWQGPSAAEEREFQAKQLAFSKMPGGAAFMQRVASYQEKLAQEFKNPEWLRPLITAALAEARKAANNLARQRGFSDPYPGE